MPALTAYTAALSAGGTNDNASLAASTAVPFVSASDLHVGAASAVVNAGTPIAGVTVDIDGDPRTAPAPEIGADELLAAELSISPTSITFGNQGVGTTSAAQTVTLANVGNAPVVVDPLTAAIAPFARSGGSCSASPITLAVGQSCTLLYTFSPTASGAAAQTLTVTSSGSGSGTIALSGTGVQGSLTISPIALSFGSQLVGSSSGELAVTLGNSGNASLDVTTLTAAAAPFARTATGTCGASLPISIGAGASCTLTYTFAPTVNGAANQSLTVTANAPGSGSIALSGTGVSGDFTVTPNPAAFGNQLVGTTSAPSTVTLGNGGTASVSVTALPLPSAPFARSGGSCAATPFTLNPGDTCTVFYTFAPTATGAASQNVTIATSPGGTTVLALSGTGIQGSLTIAPTAVAFGNQLVGSTSAAQTVTLGNSGADALNVTTLTAAAAPFARAGGTCSATLPITIAAGSNCTLTYTFAPTTGGAASQTLTVTADAPGSGTIALSGTGQPSADLSIVQTSTPSQLPQGLIQYTLQVANAGPSPVTGATVADTFAAQLSNVQWSCAGVSGGLCGVLNGTGNINRLVDLPVGATVVFSISANVPVPLLTPITNTATVSAPVGVTDTVPGNNSSTVIDLVLLFSDGFEPAAPIVPTVLSETRSGETASVVIAIASVLSAARAADPGEVAQYMIGRNLVVVQARKIGIEVQTRMLVLDANGQWQIGDWTTIDAGSSLRLEWSNGGALPLVARLRGG